MKKKIFSLILCSVLLSGCSDNSSSYQAETTQSIIETTTSTVTSITPKETLSEHTEQGTTLAMEDLFEIELPTIDEEVIIEETVIVDEAGIKITAKELVSGMGIFGTELKLLIENNTEKNLTVQCRDVSVNGYMINAMLSADVASGKKANDSISFIDSDFEKSGIEDIADIEFSFHIFDSENWDDYLDTDMIQIKTSIAEIYEYSFNHTGELIYEGNDIKIIIKGLDESSSFLGPNIELYVENNSEKNITVQTRDVSINGFMVTAMLSSDITPGKHIVDEITFINSELEENDIQKVEEVELSFHVFDSENWDTIIDTEIIKLNF
ncbi:MAG: hypothetical protein J6B08_05110 [Ruminiclostridium sp.]|nr:hypothetical protein [Ruminiclostridium sp.]